jgi:hypothetical protein
MVGSHMRAGWSVGGIARRKLLLAEIQRRRVLPIVLVFVLYGPGQSEL